MIKIFCNNEGYFARTFSEGPNDKVLIRPLTDDEIKRQPSGDFIYLNGSSPCRKLDYGDDLELTESQKRQGCKLVAPDKLKVMCYLYAVETPSEIRQYTTWKNGCPYFPSKESFINWLELPKDTTLALSKSIKIINARDQVMRDELNKFIEKAEALAIKKGKKFFGDGI